MQEKFESDSDQPDCSEKAALMKDNSKSKDEESKKSKKNLSWNEKNIEDPENITAETNLLPETPSEARVMVRLIISLNSYGKQNAYVLLCWLIFYDKVIIRALFAGHGFYSSLDFEPHRVCESDKIRHAVAYTGSGHRGCQEVSGAKSIECHARCCDSRNSSLYHRRLSYFWTIRYLI